MFFQVNISADLSVHIALSCAQHAPRSVHTVCNCLRMGAPNSVIQPLQKVQNFAARLILMAPRHHHSKPLLKVACMCFHAINGSGPTYLSELLHIYISSRTLRSSSDSRTLKIQQYNRRLTAFALSFTLDPMFGMHSHKTSGNAQHLHLLRRT